MKRTTMWMAVAAMVWLALPSRAALITSVTYQFGTNNIATNAAATFVPLSSLARVNVTQSSPTITLDGSTNINWNLTTTGQVIFATSSLSTNRCSIRVNNPAATNIYVILPTGWRKISGVTSNILSASSIGWLSMQSDTPANDTNCVSLWSSE